MRRNQYLEAYERRKNVSIFLFMLGTFELASLKEIEYPSLVIYFLTFYL